MSTLANEKCIPCRGGVPPLKGKDLTAVTRELGGDWRVIDEHHLEKEVAGEEVAIAVDGNPKEVETQLLSTLDKLAGTAEGATMTRLLTLKSRLEQALVSPRAAQRPIRYAKTRYYG